MKRISLLFLLLFSLKVFAQQEVMVSQYMFNELLLNPAYAGINKYASSSLLTRSQWVNVKGAPRTNVFALDVPIAKGHAGLGLVIVNDKFGVEENNDVSLAYSYHMPVKAGTLSFSLKGGINSINTNFSDLLQSSTVDPVYLNKESTIIPKFGFGVFYNQNKFFAGLSIPTLFAVKSPTTTLNRHYYFQVGFVQKITEMVEIKPSILLKYEWAVPMQADLNLNFLFRKMLWVGAGFRAQEVIKGRYLIGMVELQITPKLRLGYSYDYNMELQSYLGPSHEIMLGYDFRKEIIKTKNPRYF